MMLVLLCLCHAVRLYCALLLMIIVVLLVCCCLAWLVLRDEGACVLTYDMCFMMLVLL
jgi:hypothetical protein